MQLSPTLMDGSDSIDLEEDMPPVDALLYEQAYQVCSKAIHTGGSISDKLSLKLLKFLQDRHLVDVSDEEIVLTRDAVKHGLSVANAKLERDVRGQSVSSILEMQDDLSIVGWKFTSDLKSTSLEHKCAMDENPATYYKLLLHFYDSLVPYEDEGLFHHKQGEPYYKTVETALVARSDDIIEVPPYKKVDFYTRLRKFLESEDGSVKDPREEEERRHKRTGFTNLQTSFFPVR